MKLELRGITKRFPGVIANDSVDLEVGSGEILALLGENGAGKSTLMNVLYGLYSADEGDVVIDGQVQHFDSPSDAIAAGIGMVHQHFMLVPVFSVVENVVLGDEPTSWGGILNLRQGRKRLIEISERYGLAVDPDAIIEDLPVGVQQRVEIIKVLFREANFLVLDEPTAVLTPQEVADLFEILRGLRADGKGIIFITHKLNEVVEIADRISVLRRGKIVGHADPATADPQSLAELMVGRPVDLVVDKASAEPGEPILEIENLTVLDDRAHAAVNDVSLTVRRGEVLGIAGVQGNGQSELVEAITGLRDPLAGRISIAGDDTTGDSPRSIHRRGVAHIPEDRQRMGLVLEFTIAENMVLDGYYADEYSSGIAMRWDDIHDTAGRLAERYDVRTPSIDVPASTLSGGNQQKVIVAREFSRPVDLIVASQPTRGLDVGSIEYIHGQVVAQRNEGTAVLLVSTELDEVLALSDRIAVMFDGRIVAVLNRDETDATELGLYMAGSAPGASGNGNDAVPDRADDETEEVGP
ncbi:MAG: ABC transporter ATP-binding protein [Actinomycetota bacterium]